METICAQLLAFAVASTGYAAPDTCPDIKTVSREQMQEIVCGGAACRAAGFVKYADPDTVIILDVMHPSNPLARSIVVHEMVHHLQMTQGSLSADSSCDAKIRAEREAYAVQDAYLLQYGRTREGMALLYCRDND